VRQGQRLVIQEAVAKYVTARSSAEVAEAARKKAGEGLIALLRSFKIGLPGKRVDVDVDGLEFKVGYDKKPRTKMDKDALWPVLKRHGLVERVAVLDIDEDRLTKVLISEETPADVRADLEACLTTQVTRQPYVRVAK
jgi:hypothetical protein